ncbi:MAPEG family protein [Caulobacter sp. BP25]|uniref:MAPEG family protein n=1 Tax=Caulobacter sp. BP25 TaxID=2048900 RepID=UPI000C12DCB4|nr:MAPEG family protein [Caulobacter sp. BP25]PHY18950.1 glutathione S-transferase [Caulobacter sp. BP25]
MDTIVSGHAAALWAGLHLLLMLVLSVLVVRLRQKHKVALGDEGIPELARAIRAFGNATEYVPAGVAALAVLAVAGASALTIHVVGFLLFAGRVIHAVGLSNSGGVSIGRTAGMIATWLAYIFAGVALLISAIA